MSSSIWWRMRRAFASGFPLLAARAARALANLDERRIVPEIVRRLSRETDVGVQIAYASALGQLRVGEAAISLLSLLDRMPNSVWMSELNLALARLAGRDRAFIQLWRQMRADAGTRAAQAMDRCIHVLARRKKCKPATLDLVRRASHVLAQQDLVDGCHLLAEAIEHLSKEHLPPALRAILADCPNRLRQEDWRQTEALPLAIHCLSQAAEGGD